MFSPEKAQALALYAAKCMAGAVPEFNRLALVPIPFRNVSYR